MTTRAALGVWTFALACAAVAILMIATSDHTDGKVALIILAAPTGLLFIASGIIARSQRPQNRIGVLMIVVGFTWFFGALPAAGDPWVFTAGLVLSTWFTAFLAHLILAFPTGQLTSRTELGIAGAFYAVVLVAPPIAYFFDEGDLTSTACDGPCPENMLATVAAQPVATGFAVFYALGALALAGMVLVRLLLRWRRATPALRRALAPVFATAVVVIFMALLQTTVGFFSEEAAETINWLVLAAVLAVPVSLLYGLVRSRFGATTRRLVAELSEKRRPVEVQSVLRRALRDPDLELGYKVPGREGYVNVHGRPLDMPAPDDDRVVTGVGEEVIVHDAALRDQPELAEVLDAAHIALERGLSMRSLEASQRRTDALLDAVPDNVYRVARDGTVLDAVLKGSVAYPEDVVYPGILITDLIGMRVQDAMPAISDVILEGIQRALALNEGAAVEFSIDTPIGPRHMESRFRRSGDDEVVAIVRDLTERKRQEEALRALADEQAALSQVAVAVATAQRPEAVFDVVTEEVARLLGADGANLVRFDQRAGDGVIVGKWSAPGVPIPGAGTRVPLDGGSLTEVLQTGRPARMRTDDSTTPESLRARLEPLGVTSVVSAPIAVSGEPWGAVAVSLTGDQEFAPDAEERIGKFTNLVAVALANAAAREELAALADEQAALRELAVMVASEAPTDQVFAVATEEFGRLFDAAAAKLVRFGADPATAFAVGTWSDPDVSFPDLGPRLRLDGGAITNVRRTGRSSRVETNDDALPPPAREFYRRLGVGTHVAAPVFVHGELWGAVSLAGTETVSFPADIEQRLGRFAELISLALVSTETRRELAASRARIVRAGDEARQRLERNLHDGAQQRLVTLSLTLRMTQAKLRDDPVWAHGMIDACAAELALALEELRELARGLHPAILTDRGLGDALSALAARAPVPVELDNVPDERLPPPVEAAAYYVVAESLTNIAKYAEASSAHVSVARHDGVAVVEVEDDGVGGADASRGSGLRGLADRVEALEGRLVISSETGRGTRVRAEIPLA